MSQEKSTGKSELPPYKRTLFNEPHEISHEFAPSERIVVYHGDCLDLLRTIPTESLQLIITSLPYNIGKEYEK